MSRVLLRVVFMLSLIFTAACSSEDNATGEVITLTEVPPLLTEIPSQTPVSNPLSSPQSDPGGSILIPTVANIVLPDGSVISPTLQPIVTCTPRTDWGTYTVVTGDTLFDISLRFEISIEEIAVGNCLEDVNRLNVGQTLYVPGSTESVGAALRITPVVDQRGDILIVDAGTTVTISWEDAPAGTMIDYILSNFLQDGGVTTIGTVSSGIALSLTIPSTLDGEIQAIARQGDTTLDTVAVRLQTRNLADGPCQFFTAALGSPEQIFTSADTSSSVIGTAVVDTGYLVTGIVNGTQGGAALVFYQITYNGQIGYVASGRGSLRGNCSAFQQ